MIKDESGKAIAIEGITTDITERKVAEEELKKEKEFIEAALDSQIDTFFCIKAFYRKSFKME